MSGPLWALAFSRGRLLLDAAGVPDIDALRQLIGADRIRGTEVHVSVPVTGGSCRAFDLGDRFEPPAGWRLEGLRDAFFLIPASLYRAAGTARQKIEWVQGHAFCACCGSPTVRHPSHEAMACSVCDALHFPRVAPAVIVLVERDDQILLGRSPRFAPGVFSTLAGFVEPGESLEECIHREVREEVGVEVDHLRYFGSQPHPYPHSLMVGFITQWTAGDIVSDPEEIEDARWFHHTDLPTLPHPMSIARALIVDFLQRVRA